MYDAIIVGAGLAGGIIARKLADDGKRVKIVERRKHIAGNIYDYNYKGVRIQKYGPHVFHTNDVQIYDFIAKYTNPVPYETRCEAVIDGIATPSPFNFKTIDQFYSVQEAETLKKRLLEYYGNKKYITVLEMLKCKDQLIRSYANFLFEKDYKLYTAKQWGVPPYEIDPLVLERVPIALSYRDTYFDNKFEFIPENGFTDFYQNLIDSERIECETGVDARKHIRFKGNKVNYDGKEACVIYTGALDELFDYKFGILAYRSLKFDIRSYKRKSMQNVAIVAYPQAKEYTRITEYTKMPYQKCDNTVIAVEYPLPYVKRQRCEPYYPVLTQESLKCYEKYKEYAHRYNNLIFLGRLADYKYYNMDQVVLRAMEVYNSMKTTNGYEDII